MNILAPICWFLEKAFYALSQVDGQPGLNRADFDQLIAKIKEFNTTNKTGTQKAAAVASWLGIEKGDNILSWTTHVLTWIAYTYAKRKGLLK